jgi:hypothetical protein
VSFLNDLPRRTPLVVVNHAPTPSGTTDDSSTHSSPRPQTPQHIRPRSFAGYSGWGLGASPGTGTEPLALNKHRLSCVLDGTRPLPPRPSLPPFMEQSPVRAHHAHGIMVLQTENVS